jgi:DNA-binding transcriptional regulator GbsR (MarR family)
MSSHDHRRLAEEYGLLFEAQGGTRMSGRITGWLLLCSPPVQSLTAIADALGVSKGSVSEAVRLLLQMGLVERVCEPGRRGDWYRIRSGAFDHALHIERIAALRELLDRSLAAIEPTDSSQDNHVMVRDLRDFHVFLEGELPALHERWEHQRTLERAAFPSASPPGTADVPEQETA